MNSSNNYRLYTFVAGLYLSDLQKGLQTAHLVGDLSQEYSDAETEAGAAFATWARQDKTIVICTAGNHRGVENCFDELAAKYRSLGLPYSLFCEDEDSMNGMSTVAGIIVPQRLWDVKFVPEYCGLSNYWEHTTAAGSILKYTDEGTDAETVEFRFISFLKSFKLA